MITDDIFTTTICVVAGILSGILLGCGAVFVFNRIPVSWLTDYDGSSGEGALPAGENDEDITGVTKENLRVDEDSASEKNKNAFGYRTRIKEYPWKWVFSATFAVIGIYLFERDWQYALPALVTCFALLVIALSDAKYMIIPDQFVWLIVICGIGFIPYAESIKSMIFGALAGGGSLLLVALIGRLIYKKEVMGFGDIKLFAALGLVLGLRMIIIILIGSSLCSAIGYGTAIIRKKISKGDYKPLGVYIAAVAALCIVLGNRTIADIAFRLYGI